MCHSNSLTDDEQREDLRSLSLQRLSTLSLLSYTNNKACGNLFGIRHVRSPSLEIRATLTVLLLPLW